MKKIVLSIVGSMLICLCVAQERQQTDPASKSKTSKSRQQSEQSQQQPDQTRQQQDRNEMNRDQSRQQQDDQNFYANQGMVEIQKSEIPSSLKQTLQQKKYAGWENATIYYNSSTGEYVIAPRAYRFDKQGKEIEMDASSQGYGNRQGRTSRYSNDQQIQQDNQRDQYSQQQRSRDGQDQTDQESTSASRDQTENNNQSDQSAQNQQRASDDQPTPGQQNQSAQDQSAQGQEQSTSDRTGQSQQDRQPSSGYRSGQANQPGAGTQTQPGQSGRESYITDDMVEVQAEQIPASLRRTLSGSQYSGWEENGTLYQDPSTSEYVLVMDKSGNNAQAKQYRFDKNGQVKDDENGSTQSKKDQ